MEHGTKGQKQKHAFFHLLASAGEGLIAGLAAGFGQAFLPSPLVMLASALYTALRVNNVRPFYHSGGFLAGFVAFSFPAVAGAFIPFGVVLTFYLSSGAHFFATHYRSFRGWAVTAGWSVLAAFLAMFIFSSPLGILLTLLFFTGLIPLWAANLRVFHALFFVLVYLLALFLAGPRDYFSWPLWVAAAGMAVIPEMLALLYPERMYRLDSLPVITPTLTFGQKLRAVVEIIFLLIDFYALAMEKYIWLKKLTFLGKYLVAAGIILEFAPFFIKGFFLPLFFSLLPFAAGSLLLLAAAEYGATGVALAVYGLAAGVSRGLIFTAILLLLFGVVLFFGRPRETKQERARWKGLNET